MSTNIHNIELAIMNKMSSASTEIELLEYSKILKQIKTGVVHTVSTYNSLPTASESVGQMYYIEDEKTIYWANSFGWFTLPTTSTTSLLVAGNDYNNAVPDGVYTWPADISSPVQEISSSTNWCQVSVGGSFSGGGVKTDGSLYIWGGYSGYNIDAQPNENFNAVTGASIKKYTGSCDWAKVDYRGNSATALKTNGTVWSWGHNCCGNFGNNAAVTGGNRTPQQEITSSTWTTICKDNSLSAAGIKSDGTIWGFGNGSYGNWGQGSQTNYSSPVQEITSSTNWCKITKYGSSSTAAIKTDGTLWFTGNSTQGNAMNNCASSVNTSSFVQEYTGATDWTQISFNSVSLAIRTGGTLWGSGTNSSGNLGDNTVINRSSPVQEITSSTNWCCVLRGKLPSATKTDGTLWAMGSNLAGRGMYPVACGHNYQASSPVQEMQSHSGWGDVHVAGSNAAYIRLDGTF